MIQFHPDLIKKGAVGGTVNGYVPTSRMLMKGYPPRSTSCICFVDRGLSPLPGSFGNTDRSQLFHSSSLFQVSQFLIFKKLVGTDRYNPQSGKSFYSLKTDFSAHMRDPQQAIAARLVEVRGRGCSFYYGV